MDRLLLLLLGVLRSACRSRTDLVLENAALRHQLGVLMRGRPPAASDDGGPMVLDRLAAHLGTVV
jgi:hypothetical protein